MAASNCSPVHEELFQRAAKCIRENAGIEVTNEQKLQLYALFKQATVGKCNVSKPSLFDFTAKAKWDAWNKLKEMTKTEAMQLYIELVTKVQPGWKDRPSDKQPQQLKETSGKGSSGLGGPVVSTLATSNIEVIPDNEKCIFDWCKENQLEKLKKCLENGENINQKDEENMSLLHWACDRGNATMIDVLLANGADMESRDGEGQTPLHYAAFCGHEDAVKLLLNQGADKDVKDCNGETPADVCDKSISALFQ